MQVTVQTLIQIQIQIRIRIQITIPTVTQTQTIPITKTITRPFQNHRMPISHHLLQDSVTIFQKSSVNNLMTKRISYPLIQTSIQDSNVNSKPKRKVRIFLCEKMMQMRKGAFESFQVLQSD